MTSNPNSTPDLATILQTLASLNKSSSQSQDLQLNSQPPSQVSSWTPSSNHLDHQSTSHHAVPSTQQQWSLPTQNPQPPAKQIQVIDPATITDWSVGLRCVMRTVSKHDQLLGDIRKMIKVQHEHEQQWWQGREDLIRRQTARAEGQKRIDEVLKNLGGATTEPGSSNTTPEELASELKTFDMKIHRAQMQMVREMSSKLRNFGIPFFGTRSDLVIPIGKEEVTPGDGGRKLEKGMILEADLLKLQRKMLDILEDMCKD